MRLLLVEDDQNLGVATAEGLSSAFAVDWVTSAEAAASALVTTPYDLVVLDVRLPGESGLALLKRLREEKDQRPVLLLTARDGVKQRIEGLNAGADDYVVKPFDLEELLARCSAPIRRSQGRAEPVITRGELQYEPASGNVSLAGVTVPLSGRERAILYVLMSNIGRVISRAQIESHIYDWSSELIESNTIEVHVSSIRRKLGRELIKTIRGAGYMIPPWQPEHTP